MVTECIQNENFIHLSNCHHQWVKIIFLFILNKSLDLGPLEGDFKSCEKCVVCLGHSKSLSWPYFYISPSSEWISVLTSQRPKRRNFIFTELKRLVPEECAGDSDLKLRVIQVSFLSALWKTNNKKKQKPNFGKHSYLAFRKSKLNTSTTEGMDDILVIHL